MCSILVLDCDAPTPRKLLSYGNPQDHSETNEGVKVQSKMYLISYTLASLIATLQLVAPSAACVPNIRSTTDTAQNQTYPWSKLGSDAPSDPETAGYFVNHLSLNVKNVTRSVEFYSNIFGLRHMFTFHVSEHITLTYMGHSHGGKNGTGYQTAEELTRQKNNVEGLMELIHVDVPNKQLPGSAQVTTTFSHLGIVVPDIVATQKRLEAHGARVFKPLGQAVRLEDEITKTTTFNDIFKLDEEEQKLAWAVLEKVNSIVIFVMDPDDNMIEIQPAEGAGLT